MQVYNSYFAFGWVENPIKISCLAVAGWCWWCRRWRRRLRWGKLKIGEEIGSREACFARSLGHFWTNFMTLLQLEDGTNMIVIGQWCMQYSYSHLLDIIIQWYSIYLRPFIGKAVWMIAITQDLTLWRIRQDWSFSLMCCETFMIRWPTPVFTYAVHYKNTLPHIHNDAVDGTNRTTKKHLESWPSCSLLIIGTVGKIRDQSKGVEWQNSCTGAQSLRRQLWKGGTFESIVFTYIYIYIFLVYKKYVLYLN